LQLKDRTWEEVEAGFERFYALCEEHYNVMRNNGDLGQWFTGVLFVLNYILSDFSEADGWKVEWFHFVLDCATGNIANEVVQAMDACAETARATQDMLRTIV
jgi:hypothetical protein